MNDYNKRSKIGPATIFFLFLFSSSIVGLAVISYFDRGRSWDMLPYFCVPIIVLSLIFGFYNLIRRCNAGIVFFLFFIIFTISLVLSSIFGPVALKSEATSSMEEKNYRAAVESFDSLLSKYPSSRYAVEALQQISFAYYYNNQFQESLTSFDSAITANVIDPEQLNILEIRQNIYFHIAQQQENREDYLKAASSYLNSVDILKQIKSNFPDTNEAFIALFKIPRYLFNASINYEKYGDTISQIELLQEIISDHTESDYYQDALKEIDNAYIDRAIELSSEADYDVAIDWFLKFLDNNPEPEIDRFFSDKIMIIFGEAPPSIIKNTADARFSKGDFFTAVFLYEILIDFNPIFLEVSTDNLVISKGTLIRSSSYNEILQSVNGSYINTPGLSLLVIANETGAALIVYVNGQENHIDNIAAGEIVEIEVVPGEYTVFLESKDEKTLPYMGSITFEEFTKYTEVIKEPEENSSS